MQLFFYISLIIAFFDFLFKCYGIIWDIESLYNWDGKLCCERETLLSIKTKKELFSKVKSKILELHSYDTPEIIELDISNISEDYLKFIKENTI